MQAQQPYFTAGFQHNMEEVQLDDLSVKGDIPAWLEGSLIRNGPGLVQADKPMRHWFDGLAMLHKFSFAGGKVSYQSRFLDCEAYRAVRDTGKMTYSDFATDPCRSLFGKVQTVFESDPKITDSAKVSVGMIGGKAFALGEPLMQVQFDPETLESVGVFHYGKNPANRMTTAHPHLDQGEAYNLVVQYGPINYYKIYSMVEGVKELASIPVREPAYLHSFGMSKRYFIIAEYPFVVQSIKLLLRFRPFIENFKWKGRQGTRFFIIDREDGQLKATIKTEALFSFHHVNAFEQGDELTVDLAAYEDAGVIEHYYHQRLASPTEEIPFGRMERFVFDLKAKRLKSRQALSEACIELPHIDYARYHGDSSYRYIYGCGIHPQRRNEFYNQLVKIDVQTGQHLSWHEPGYYPGEAVFVPFPERQAEDDGLLLSVVLDGQHGRSFLLVLDAQNMQERARAELPHPVLFGYHGAFLGR
jgi:beta,beta-carotene 9',10'-dioxygenase